jgi:hypothetical protein
MRSSHRGVSVTSRRRKGDVAAYSNSNGRLRRPRWRSWAVSCSTGCSRLLGLVVVNAGGMFVRLIESHRSISRRNSQIRKSESKSSPRVERRWGTPSALSLCLGASGLLRMRDLPPRRVSQGASLAGAFLFPRRRPLCRASLACWSGSAMAAQGVESRMGAVAWSRLANAPLPIPAHRKFLLCALTPSDELDNLHGASALRVLADGAIVRQTMCRITRLSN